MLLVSSMSPLRCHSVRLNSATSRLCLDLHLLQVFVGGVFIAVVLHLAKVPFLWCQHGVNLWDRRTAFTLDDLNKDKHKSLR